MIFILFILTEKIFFIDINFDKKSQKSNQIRKPLPPIYLHFSEAIKRIKQITSFIQR